MNPKKRTVWAWSISFLVHVLLVLIVFPGVGQAAGNAGLIEVGLVDIPGDGGGTQGMDQLMTVPRPGTAEQDRSTIEPEPVDAVGDEPLPPEAAKESTQKEAETSDTTQLQKVEQSAGGGTGSGQGSGGQYSGFQKGRGTGFAIVESSPLLYPKNAQNEGVEGRVRLAVYFKPGAKAKAEILEGSGDKRLDDYSVRAVAEGWKYAPPPEPLRLVLSLIFKDGKVSVDFEGSEPWREEESRP